MDPLDGCDPNGSIPGLGKLWTAPNSGWKFSMEILEPLPPAIVKLSDNRIREAATMEETSGVLLRPVSSPSAKVLSHASLRDRFELASEYKRSKIKILKI